ncbi:MAG: chromosome segregation protein SMC [Burkholderiales bacterium]
MFLKSIEMSGFKSFPEKTVINMNGSITGVVGPNGSGKSNVSDAVRWVLGEQSPKTLRGTVMQDVIFAGTQTRKPRSFCEVSLIFDNSDKRVDSAFSEIQITRKLYSSGEGEYFINGAKCRLKDILTMFRDTGIGKEGYSIIGQGRIDEILSERSVDRRRVFEEASGIMKYRVRKEEAERKLEKTRFNLIRIEDILQEQRLRLEPLKVQADAAMEYLKLSERLKHLEVNLFLHSYESGKDRIEKLKQTKLSLSEERERKREELKELEQLYLAEQENAKTLEKAGSELSDKLSVSLAEVQRVEGEIKLCNERMANLEKDSRRVEEEIKELTAKRGALDKSIAANSRRISDIDKEINDLKNAALQISDEIAKLTGDYQDRVKFIEAAQVDRLAAIEKIGDVKSTLSALNEKQQFLKRQADEAAQRLESLEKQREEYMALQAKLKSELEFSAAKSSEIRERYNGYVAARNKAQEESAALVKSLEGLKREHAACTSSLRMLSDMKNSYEGYIGSVKRLMNAAKQDGSLARRIKGTFADLISVPQKFETAIEICLGQALQDVVVGDEDDAKALISFLRSNDLGRVTFLPLSALRPRYLSDQERKSLNEKGVYGVASDLVSCGGDVKKAVDFLLGRTVIVDSSDTAIRIMRGNGYSFRAVTIDGDIFNPGGAITGGSTKREVSGLISRDRKEEELRARETELSTKISEIEAVIAAKQKEYESILDDIESARQQLHANEVEMSAVREKLEAAEASSTEAEKSVNECRAQIEELKSDLSSVEGQLAEYDALRSDLEHISEAKDEDYKRLEEEYSRNASVVEEKRKLLHDTDIRIAELYRESASLVSDNERIEREKLELDKSKAVKNKTLELNAESKENLIKLRQQLETLYKQKTLATEQIRKSQSHISGERESLNRALAQKDESIISLRKEISDLGERLMRTDFNIEKAETSIQDAQNKLWDTYRLTYANALPERENINISEAQNEAEQIREKIREMGSVNPNAIEDYNELKNRMETLTTQKDDLIVAEEDLRKLIASLLDEMKKTFKTSFEQINRYFNQTFQELFSGGSARLVLEDDEDIMECGIEIIAEPPGKKLQKISLLSGGEKALTAIALLFALLKINPSPVCILDEIDAALDDANVYKLADYLQKYAKKMQFIVITHKKPTMVICDSLYGFAMEEKGVSKLLSVRLD